MFQKEYPKVSEIKRGNKGTSIKSTKDPTVYMCSSHLLSTLTFSLLQYSVQKCYRHRSMFTNPAKDVFGIIRCIRATHLPYV